MQLNLKKQFMVFIFICIIGIIFLHTYSALFMKSYPINGCIKQSNTKLIRGKNYYICDITPEDMKILETCLLTKWNLIHVCFHTIITFLFPEYCYAFFLFGIFYEWYEYIAYQCEDLLDIIYNTIGIFLGLCLRNIYNLKFNKQFV